MRVKQFKLCIWESKDGFFDHVADQALKVGDLVKHEFCRFFKLKHKRYSGKDLRMGHVALLLEYADQDQNMQTCFISFEPAEPGMHAEDDETSFIGGTFGTYPDGYNCYHNCTRYDRTYIDLTKLDCIDVKKIIKLHEKAQKDGGFNWGVSGSFMSFVSRIRNGGRQVTFNCVSYIRYLLIEAGLNDYLTFKRNLRDGIIYGGMPGAVIGIIAGFGFGANIKLLPVETGKRIINMGQQRPGLSFSRIRELVESGVLFKGPILGGAFLLISGILILTCGPAGYLAGSLLGAAKGSLIGGFSGFILGTVIVTALNSLDWHNEALITPGGLKKIVKTIERIQKGEINPSKLAKSIDWLLDRMFPEHAVPHDEEAGFGSGGGGGGMTP